MTAMTIPLYIRSAIDEFIKQHALRGVSWIQTSPCHGRPVDWVIGVQWAVILNIWKQSRVDIAWLQGFQLDSTSRTG